MLIRSCADEGASCAVSCIYNKNEFAGASKNMCGPFHSMWDSAGGCIILMWGSAACLNVAEFTVPTTDPGNLFHIRTALGNTAYLYASIVALGMAYLI